MSTCATLPPIARVSTDRMSRFQRGWMTGGICPINPRGSGLPRFPRWLVAIGLGVPLVLIAVRGFRWGTVFFYVVVGIPALLLTWAIAGVGAIVVSVRCAMRKEWRRSSASTSTDVLLAVARRAIGWVRACNHTRRGPLCDRQAQLRSRGRRSSGRRRFPSWPIRLGRHGVGLDRARLR